MNPVGKVEVFGCSGCCGSLDSAHNRSIEECIMATENRTVAEMIAELLREAALLVGVFVPLDMVFSEKPVSRTVLGFATAIFLLCLISGIVIERLR
jgi:hypothetical protein